MTPQDPNFLIQLIGSLGFPIAVTAWLLVKGGKIVSDITVAIQNLQVTIQKLIDRQGGAE